MLARIQNLRHILQPIWYSAPDAVLILIACFFKFIASGFGAVSVVLAVVHPMHPGVFKRGARLSQLSPGARLNPSGASRPCRPEKRLGG